MPRLPAAARRTATLLAPLVLALASAAAARPATRPALAQSGNPKAMVWLEGPL